MWIIKQTIMYECKQSLRAQAHHGQWGLWLNVRTLNVSCEANRNAIHISAARSNTSCCHCNADREFEIDTPALRASGDAMLRALVHTQSKRPHHLFDIYSYTHIITYHITSIGVRQLASITGVFRSQLRSIIVARWLFSMQTQHTHTQCLR